MAKLIPHAMWHNALLWWMTINDLWKGLEEIEKKTLKSHSQGKKFKSTSPGRINKFQDTIPRKNISTFGSSIAPPNIINHRSIKDEKNSEYWEHLRIKLKTNLIPLQI